MYMYNAKLAASNTEHTRTYMYCTCSLNGLYTCLYSTVFIYMYM